MRWWRYEVVAVGPLARRLEEFLKPAAGYLPLHRLEGSHRGDSWWRRTERSLSQVSGDRADRGCERLVTRRPPGPRHRNDVAWRRAALHGHARRHERHIGESRAYAGGRPVDEHHAIVAEQYVVGPDVGVQKCVTGQMS